MGFSQTWNQKTQQRARPPTKTLQDTAHRASVTSPTGLRIAIAWRNHFDSDGDTELDFKDQMFFLKVNAARVRSGVQCFGKKFVFCVKVVVCDIFFTNRRFQFIYPLGN